MTHTQLIKTIAKQVDLKPQEVAILWQQTSKIMMNELGKHEKIRIKNFGAFVTVKHKSRTVPDPRERTKKLVIFDQFLPKFRPSEELRRKVKDVLPQSFETEPELPERIVAEPAVVEEPINQETDETPLSPPKKPAKKITSRPSLNIGFADLNNLTVDPEILELIPFHIAEKYQLAPIGRSGKNLVVAMTDPGDREAIELINRQTGLEIEPQITTQGDLKHVLDQYSVNTDLESIVGDKATAAIEANDETVTDAESSDAPAAKVISSLLERAVREKASDIHIEPEEKRVVVRFRIDGILHSVMELPKNLQSSVTARLKILSNLKIDESRLPQDGRIRLTIDKKEIDFRLSTLPTVAGEKFVMRILDKSAGILTFEQLGIENVSLKRIEDNIEKAHGMILVTGPTGSGKTTTLYSMIGRLMGPGINIVTLEDPVEYRIIGINQSQVNSAIDYSFASGLRTIVRQDPDVILIGEIRDLETAEMAIHSALTGHVVLSTLHTNDAAGAIPRLIDMGIEPFLITSSTNAVMAQRLVRRICPKCKQKVKIPPESLGEVEKELTLLPEKEKNQLKTLTFYQGKGCDQCNKTGYAGRFGIYETLSMSEPIKQLVLKRVSASQLSEQAVSEGMVTMKQDGLLKALDSQTTLEEIWRVTKD